jgi:microcompartment protein CcmL/EutN
MESNNTNEEFFIGASPLAEPHFDEEATLLSARPVVPLHEVEVEVRFRKRMLFGLAMACSLTMGALAATLIYKQRGNGQPTSISTAVPGAAGIAVDGTVSSPETAAEAGSASGALPEAGGPTVESKSVHRSAESTVVETKRQESLAQQREDREPGAERINARHLRRRSERQERRTFSGRQRKSADDLLRIREIFEGPSRP